MPDPLPQLESRKADAHKGDFGRALLVGGSRGMTGAISLAGMAALRGGAGLVTLAVGESVLDVAASFDPCSINSFARSTTKSPGVRFFSDVGDGCLICRGAGISFSLFTELLHPTRHNTKTAKAAKTTILFIIGSSYDPVKKIPLR